MWSEFKVFAVRGNVIDLAVGLVLGAAFGAIVKSLVDDVVMPPAGLLIGGVDFSEAFVVLKDPPVAGAHHTAADVTKAGGVVLRYGAFANTIISFVIIAFAVFLLVRGINRLKAALTAPEAPAAPTTRDCPYCLLQVPHAATRCGHCTSTLPSAS